MNETNTMKDLFAEDDAIADLLPEALRRQLDEMDWRAYGSLHDAQADQLFAESQNLRERYLRSIGLDPASFTSRVSWLQPLRLKNVISFLADCAGRPN